MEDYTEVLNKLLKALKNSTLKLSSIPIGEFPEYDVYLSKLKEFELSNRNYKNSILYTYENMDLIIKKLSKGLLGLSKNIFSTDSDMFTYTNLLSAFKDIILDRNNIDAAYDLAKKNYPEECEETNKEELENLIKEEVNNPIGFQEKLGDKVDNLYKKNHFVIWFIKVILALFVLPYLQQNIGVPVMTNIVSNVRELPSNAGKVIGKLETEIEAVIVGNEKYYYKVKYIDKIGVEQEGYVAKRNLKLLKDEETVSGNEVTK